MPAGFYRLRVKKINRETKDAISIQFEIPVELKEQFSYKAGQYLTFSMMISGEEVRRSYSVCSSPYIETDPVIAVKQVEDGRMSTYLNTVLREGDFIEVMPPLGKFTVEIEPALGKHYVLFGGGSGITPLLSIIKTVLLKEPQAKLLLYYANRDIESIIFKEEIDGIRQESAGRFKIIYSLDKPEPEWTGDRDYLNPAKVSEIVRRELGLNYPGAKYYTCGPSPMMDVVVKGLESAGVVKENIYTEYFTAAVKTESTSIASEESDSGELKDRKIKVEVFGQQKEILVREKDTILIAAQEAGLDPPYSCTVGVCTTCRARLRSGRVMMDEREGLSDMEIEQGYILTCQGHPLSDDVDLVYE